MAWSQKFRLTLAIQPPTLFFINQRCADCVCLHAMDFVSAGKNTLLLYVAVCENLHHGWISTMTSSNAISWKLPPPKWGAGCAADGPLQKIPPGSHLWLRHRMWGAALFDSPRGGTFPRRIPVGWHWSFHKYSVIFRPQFGAPKLCAGALPCSTPYLRHCAIIHINVEFEENWRFVKSIRHLMRSDIKVKWRCASYKKSIQIVCQQGIKGSDTMANLLVWANTCISG